MTEDATADSSVCLHDMTAVVENVTPSRAKEFLSKSRGNRSIRYMRVEKYVIDQREGRWHLSPHGLCFDVDGYFCDGHHRCHAVIKSGITQRFLICRNVALEMLPYIDAGLPRSARDALAMAGLGDYSPDLITTARCLDAFPTGPAKKYMAPADILPTIHAHAEALSFSCTLFRSHSAGISRAVRVLVAKAWYYEDADRLSEFAKALCSGLVANAEEDCAAIVYRNFLLRNSKLGGVGMTAEKERYRKGQVALDAFARRDTITKLYGTEKDLYPLPHADDSE